MKEISAFTQETLVHQYSIEPDEKKTARDESRNPSLSSPDVASVRHQLNVRGWARFDASNLALTRREWSELSFLASYAETLPIDRFGGNGRRRAYGEGVVDVMNRRITWKGGHPDEGGGTDIDYLQSKVYQPEYGGVIRHFRRVNDAVVATRLVNKLIWYDLSLIPLAECHTQLLCGLHVICLMAIAAEPARITPDCLHQDGQPYTAVHLIRRHNAEGGVNYIASPVFSGSCVETVPCDQLRDFTLHDALDSYVINDVAVSHYVTPVSCDAPSLPATRSILIVDFTPIP